MRDKPEGLEDQIASVEAEHQIDGVLLPSPCPSNFAVWDIIYNSVKGETESLIKHFII